MKTRRRKQTESHHWKKSFKDGHFMKQLKKKRAFLKLTADKYINGEKI